VPEDTYSNLDRHPRGEKRRASLTPPFCLRTENQPPANENDEKQKT